MLVVNSGIILINEPALPSSQRTQVPYKPAFTMSHTGCPDCRHGFPYMIPRSSIRRTSGEKPSQAFVVGFALLGQIVPMYKGGLGDLPEATV